VDGEGGTGLGLGRSKAGSALPDGCHVVGDVGGCVEYDDAWDVGLDIEDLDTDEVELFFLCLIGNLIGLALLEVVFATSGSVKAVGGLTARETRLAF
jgi:hypothetical protein